LTTLNKEVVIETGGFLTSAEDAGRVVVGVYRGKPVYLKEVADVVDGAEEPSQYVFYGQGAASGGQANEEPAVTLTLAKRPGANAIDVTDHVLKKLDTLKGRVPQPLRSPSQGITVRHPLKNPTNSCSTC
jgi:multidrug efflux pump subunit AcrB